MMATRFVEVPREALLGALQNAGFTQVPPRTSDEELLFERKHNHDAELSVRVFTTIPGAGAKARACGEDAIRVGLFAAGKTHPEAKTARWVPIFWATKVLRTGSVEKVIERTIERAREAYAQANLCVRRGRCKQCGSVVYPDSGRCIEKICRQLGGGR